ncbi:MAG: hypothetical protein KUA35_10355 [Pseudodesulfovibrio sp.]|uniref:Uncharacterized protein n=1 Tax=Pseudodesulfovibrio aespoeensis (strain ATCC 700646 / DSM 10631 / Aspo-2) TaxID=643562 RepID=E6VUC6_PSEA9|nr:MULTISPECIES: hypothetical protein [Pseudodesulfovibrio]MBU4191367.1 hypothetical protein [Pseudomonadota bacterium]ADU63433.1 hypothetical protein Daes_2428 [Pseudodesulfovibrio aespoeensis Aspo-2]MBU4243480.1 hypothetical protein [Pseudomonadota bacterium]MBU4380251.1 hypothetical protein [Pseudomonadota bacterium]MBU4473814.1 hypothetical protein [Pseudomonadota bacterium]
MSDAGLRRALHAAEAQTIRHGKTIRELLRLLRSVREDGGLNSAQCEALDQLVARNELVMTGLLDEADTLHPESGVARG